MTGACFETTSSRPNKSRSETPENVTEGPVWMVEVSHLISGRLSGVNRAKHFFISNQGAT